MQTVVLEFDSERKLEEAMHHLWDQSGVSGEMLAHRLQEGVWRLEIVSEQSLRPSLFEKSGGRVVQS